MDTIADCLENEGSAVKENSGIFQPNPYFSVLYAIKFHVTHLLWKMAPVWSVET